MWTALTLIALVAWQWLPDVTTALRFVTALIGFALAIHLLVRRVRIWLRRYDR